ncbi:MAG: hypothetical protein ISS49_00435 [Anaerolineae bacterium]|nr:hypothetical protein [Anaerolineae bacterium]
MLQRRVIIMAALAVLLLLAGLAALILPDPYEGPVYLLNAGHAISALDGLGVVLLTLGCAVAWGAGLVWQRWMYD